MVIFFHNHFGSRLDLKRARAQATPNSCLYKLPWEHGLCILVSPSLVRDVCHDETFRHINYHVGMVFAFLSRFLWSETFVKTRLFGISIAMKAWRMHHRRDSSSTESSANFVLKLSSLSFTASSCSLLIQLYLNSTMQVYFLSRIGLLILVLANRASNMDFILCPRGGRFCIWKFITPCGD